MSVLRPAVSADAAPLGAILQVWLDQTAWMPDLHDLSGTVGGVRWLIKRQDTVADADDVPVGFLSRADDEVDALYMGAAHRGQDIGAARLTHAKQHRARLSLRTFQANRRARAFYERHGFVETQRTSGDNAEGLPDIAMTWTVQREDAP